MRVIRLFLFVTFCISNLFANPTQIFINEIHYDNAGADAGEAIEIAGPAGTDLSNWKIVLYNGANGVQYGSLSLSGIIPNQSNSFGTLSFDRAGIQNGAPDGLALIDPSGSVIQFLSYEGSFTATDGEANGLESVDIGVSETTTTPIGESLQLGGSGNCYEDFTWQSPTTSTFGNINTNQQFANGNPTPNISVSVSLIDFGTIAPGETATQNLSIENTGSADLEISNISELISPFSIQNLPTFPHVLGSGESLTLTFSYAPISPNVDNSSLTIFSNDLNNPQISIDVIGIAVEPQPSIGIVINEIDVDQSSIDTQEFIELFDGGNGLTSLDGLVLVFFNGTTDASYRTINLSGFSTNANGYFVIGNAAVPNVDLSFANNILQNGADAVALFQADASDFPNGTLVTADNLVDAVVYDTNDPDDVGLLQLLNTTQPQLNEDENNAAITESLQRVPNGSGGERNTLTFVAKSPTPGASNDGIVLPPSEPEIVVSTTTLDFGNVNINEISEEKFLTILNSGNAILEISELRILNTVFSIENLPALPFSLSENQEIELELLFAPTLIGNVNSELHIFSNDADEPILIIQLNGIGIENTPPPITTGFTLLAAKNISSEKFGIIEGNLHSNKSIEFKSGDFGTVYGNLSAGNQIKISSKNTVNGDVTAPKVKNNGEVNGSISSLTPNQITFPEIQPFTIGDEDIYVFSNTERLLAPGNYEDIEVGKSATLTISSGIYYAEDLEIQENGKLIVDVSNGKVDVFLEEEFDLHDFSVVEIGGGSSELLKIHSTENGNIKLMENSIFYGEIYAPNASVKIQKNAFVSGKISAEKISLQENTIVVPHNSTRLPNNAIAKTADEILPEQFKLHQNYPNPFNPSTTIAFDLPTSSDVKLQIYNVRGQLVNTLIDASLNAGTHEIIWNATSNSSQTVASGVYFYVIQTPNFRKTMRMILLK